MSKFHSLIKTKTSIYDNPVLCMLVILCIFVLGFSLSIGVVKYLRW